MIEEDLEDWSKFCTGCNHEIDQCECDEE